MIMIRTTPTNVIVIASSSSSSSSYYTTTSRGWNVPMHEFQATNCLSQRMYKILRCYSLLRLFLLLLMATILFYSSFVHPCHNIFPLKQRRNTRKLQVQQQPNHHYHVHILSFVASSSSASTKMMMYKHEKSIISNYQYHHHTTMRMPGTIFRQTIPTIMKARRNIDRMCNNFRKRTILRFSNKNNCEDDDTNDCNQLVKNGLTTYNDNETTLQTNNITTIIQSQQQQYTNEDLFYQQQQDDWCCPYNVPDRTIQLRQLSDAMLPIQIYRSSSKHIMDQRNQYYAIDKEQKNDLQKHDDRSNMSDVNTSVTILPLMDETCQQTLRKNKRMIHKQKIEQRAQNPLSIQHHLNVLYVDEHICVVNKPSGVLSVPGVRNNPSIAGLVHEMFVKKDKTTTKKSMTTDDDCDINTTDNDEMQYYPLDKMIVHRLDMDTSGVMVFALNEHALKQLHTDFREHKTQHDNDTTSTTTSSRTTGGTTTISSRRIYKSYQALLVGHFERTVGNNPKSIHNNNNIDDDLIVEIDIALERDPDHPPFMRIAKERTTTARTRANHQKTVNTNHANVAQPISSSPSSSTSSEDSTALPSTSKMAHSKFQKFIDQQPKPSYTEMTIVSKEYISSTTLNSSSSSSSFLYYPVTRVNLYPHTGRTHQLRVHTAAIGYPIVGDNIYGYYNGDGNCGTSSMNNPFYQHEDDDDDDNDNHNNNNDDHLLRRKQQQLHKGIHDNVQIPLCLHAQTLCLFHPYTGSPMMFTCLPPF